jgi:acyl carrier protein
MASRGEANREEIERLLIEALYGIEDVPADAASRLKGLDVDSLQLVEIALLAEDTWGIDLLASDLDAVRTAGDVMDLIASHDWRPGSAADRPPIDAA